MLSTPVFPEAVRAAIRDLAGTTALPAKIRLVAQVAPASGPERFGRDRVTWDHRVVHESSSTENTSRGRQMIGKLRGKVDAIGESHAVIDVNGVGYEVQASARTLRNLKLGDEVALSIETHVREDAIRLYGFTSEVERAWFRTLQTIQGVGSKVALSVLGTLSTQDLANAIALQNWAAVEQTPGVGKKLAQRIVAELKDKAPALSAAGLTVPAAGANGRLSVAGVGNKGAAPGSSALTHVGHQPRHGFAG